jgi:hypothetical protein
VKLGCGELVAMLGVRFGPVALPDFPAVPQKRLGDVEEVGALGVRILEEQ